MKICISCGMPMSKTSDYPLGDESKNYCVYCARPDGSMKSYSEELESMAEFLIHTQGLDPKAAHEMASRTLAKLPAWENREGGKV